MHSASTSARARCHITVPEIPLQGWENTSRPPQGTLRTPPSQIRDLKKLANIGLTGTHTSGPGIG
ncbi:hypothetical protein CC1G_15183 [Coprinopsis cinerea okayama7|uniref:Uncharacterized protein n=1 Tax=Coprinopsis cinerea (strain Okayama-7 / 130 / ATCC MYA-4618 / FGSC 9003) TaxID=240176 RepID=D6RPN0_COPC7|nr:hypothetical protein CC1G_15183 [Coprinopsis cinerea okayama7\|eukprot:XP_002910544.1 hypothetical protein CC1G_15183 [Coprinopsis cinerea okayama7\